MSTKDDGGPAFPESCNDQIIPGMRLRDYFASKALQGILSQPDDGLQIIRKNAEEVEAARQEIRQSMARVAYRYADAMLEARK